MRPRKSAFTIVELLVVIAIIGVLVALLLPAIQAAREAARRTQCKSQLKQLALASLNHHDVHKFFPSGGWGWEWVGDKDRGAGRSQPGGWVFSILPYIEEDNGYQLAGDGDREFVSRDQRIGAAQLIENPITIINCPTRRPPRAYPLDRGARPPTNVIQLEIGGKLDYAANTGDQRINFGWAGPDYTSGVPLSEIAAGYKQWCTTGNTGKRAGSCPHPASALTSPLTGNAEYSGISFERSQIAIKHTTDGTSNTYLIGEKYLNSTQYEVANSAENETWCSGFNNDNHRTTFYPPHQDHDKQLAVEDFLNVGADPQNEERRFGSAHAAGCHMAFCDGSVGLVAYDVDIIVYRAGGNRNDGVVAER